MFRGLSSQLLKYILLDLLVILVGMLVLLYDIDIYYYKKYLSSAKKRCPCTKIYSVTKYTMPNNIP